MPCPYLVDDPRTGISCKAVVWDKKPGTVKTIVLPRPLTPSEVKKCMDDKLWPKCPDYIRAKAYEK